MNFKKIIKTVDELNWIRLLISISIITLCILYALYIMHWCMFFNLFNFTQHTEVFSWVWNYVWANDIFMLDRKLHTKGEYGVATLWKFFYYFMLWIFYFKYIKKYKKKNYEERKEKRYYFFYLRNRKDKTNL